jgi:hypothetical protein
LSDFRAGTATADCACSVALTAQVSVNPEYATAR